MANVEAINKVIYTIRSAEPERFKMEYVVENKLKPCNTAACIAGWTCLAHMDHNKIASEDLTLRQMESAAQGILGIDEMERVELFYMDYIPRSDVARLREIVNKLVPNDWPEDVGRLSLFDELPAQLRQQAGIRVLEILHNTGEVRWMQAIEEACKSLGYQV